MRRYLRHELPSLAALAKARGMSDDRIELRLRHSLDHFLAHTSWPALPSEGPVIVIADAMVRQVAGMWHTFYFIFIRPVKSTQALIAPLYIAPGEESVRGWEHAFAKIPAATRHAIRALVCDGHRGLVYYARAYGWLLQRCHFHLIASIQGRRSRWAHSRHRAEGERLYQLVHRILTLTDEEAIVPFVVELEEFGWDTDSVQLQKVISGFVNHYAEYRTYLRYPDLHLPRTSNAAESFIGFIQHFCHRARGFRTIHSFSRWIEAIIKTKQTITCNGFHQPN